MNQIRDFFNQVARRFTAPVERLPSGTYHFQAPPEAEVPYRLHLRVEPDGNGLLIVNASTVLHLNQTATEYAYHLVHQTPAEEAARVIASRYQVSVEQASDDFANLGERIETLILMPDLDPVTFLDFDRAQPHTASLSAPLRLDIALTYRTDTGTDPRATPRDRVRRELTHQEWQAVLVKTWEAGIPHLIFTGGEPTLRSDLPELIEQAEKQGQVTGLLTDGLRLAETEYLHRLLQSGLDHLMITLNPGKEESWEALRDTLAEDIFTTVHVTITEENREKTTDLFERLARMGVKSVSISASTVGLADEVLAAREAAATRQMSLVWDLPVPYSDLHPVALEGTEEAPAGAGRVWLYLEPDADVLPMQGSERILGNLSEQPWNEIWQKAQEAA